MSIIYIGTVKDCWRYSLNRANTTPNVEKEVANITLDNIYLLDVIPLKEGDIVKCINTPLPNTDDMVVGVVYSYVAFPDSPQTVQQCELQASDWQVIRALEDMFLADTELHAKRNEFRAQVPAKYASPKL